LIKTHLNNVVSEMSKNKKETSIDWKPIKDERIMSRASILTDSCWLHAHPTTIHVFKTKEYMYEWKILDMTEENNNDNNIDNSYSGQYILTLWVLYTNEYKRPRRRSVNE